MVRGHKQIEGRREGEADAELPALAPTGPPYVPDRLLGTRQDPAGVFEQHRPGIRQFEAAWDPVKELGAELTLERLDLLAQRRLGDPQSFCRAPEIPFLGYGDGVAQLP